jgi:hypothetical protein
MTEPTIFSTDFANDYASGIVGAKNEFLASATMQGLSWLRAAGVSGRVSDDLCLAAYMTANATKALPNTEDSYLMAGEISDQISDHDAELLVEMDPAVRSRVGSEVGAMTAEVTAVHDLLLDVASAVEARIREREESDV